MTLKFVTSTEFQNSAGRFFDEARKSPVGIKKHGVQSHVLMDFDTYQKLQELATAAVRAAKLDAAIADGHERYGKVFEHLAK